MDYFHAVYLTINREERKRERDCEGKAEELARNAAIEGTRTYTCTHTHTHTLKWDDCSSFKNRAIYDAIGRGSRRLFNYLVKLLRKLEEIPSRGGKGETRQWCDSFFVKVVFEKGRLVVRRIFSRMTCEKRYQDRRCHLLKLLHFKIESREKCYGIMFEIWEKYQNRAMGFLWRIENGKKRGRRKVVRCFSDVGRYSVGISKSHREYEVIEVTKKYW